MSESGKLAVELLYFDGCPTYKTALRDIEEIVKQEGLDANATLVRVGSEEEAVRLRFLGSPTIRVSGVDVELVTKTDFADTSSSPSGITHLSFALSVISLTVA